MTAANVFFELSLFLSAFLCTLVFGKMLVFQTVVMPGISNLNDREYLRAFQVIDGVIQKNEPVFVSVWIGSVVSLLVTTVSCIALDIKYGDSGGVSLDGSTDMALLVLSTIAWLIGNYTTFTINVPLNNRVKVLDLIEMDAAELTFERRHFESKWIKWHKFRVVLFGTVSLILLALLMVTDEL
eukprot:CAMPEP_0178870354 /NCGR_PEP_ID=MMETSP0747-20121128/7028_1 /TAXON_ID=913974 /ORGANISM="Nitzschia punctata, Strain CCMP561" /LENGTH=182 /DNA_ID=CAMNT_0020537461 /DNA_START=12 /DNA_END=560 /DNA_ORIENTATION=+